MNSIDRDGKTFYLSDDGKEYKSRSGAWKQNKKLVSNSEAVGEDSPPDSFNEPTSSEQGENTATESAENTATESAENTATESATESPKWMQFQMGDQTDTTDVLPEPLKMLSAQGGKKNLSAKEKKAAKDTELAMLTLILSGTDHLLTSYGKAITLDASFLVKHSEKSKKIVAEAQYAYLEEKGIMLSSYMSKGVVAGALTGWYILSPLTRIKRAAKRPMIKRIGGGFLSKLPLIGRWFKPKAEDSLFQGVEA
tara:strand:- start:6662 stop:7420 length:759 start_codon:yes stop_codon:yes gene_type:complete